MNQNVIFRLLQETDINAKYDAEAKKLLSNKEILSRILKYSVDEFKDFSISEIIDSIEGEPVISKINVRPVTLLRTLQEYPIRTKKSTKAKLLLILSST